MPFNIFVYYTSGFRLQQVACVVGENRKWKSDTPKGNKTDFYRIYIRASRKTFVKDLDRLSTEKNEAKKEKIWSWSVYNVQTLIKIFRSLSN